MRWRRDGWMLGVALLLAPAIWFLFSRTPIDHVLIAPYYDVQTRSFPLRSDLFMQSVMHDGLKMIIVTIGVVLFGGFLLTFVMPQWRIYRRRLIWMFAAMIGSTLLVSLIKHASGMHCPWDLADYGGYAPLERLFEHMPVTAGGNCFPGGHASGGFSLMAFYFGWRHVDALQARLGLVVALTLGMVMGWAQMIRGAHFLSHNVWSAWVVWTFMAVLYHLYPPQAATPSEDTVSI